MGIEGGYAIENSLYALRNFYRLGIRYMTLTHNVSHDWADAHRDTPKNNGLSDFGKEVVREMNRLGMLIDISHVSDSTFYQVMRLSKAPCIASHSSCRFYTPGFIRNMSDDMIKKLGENNGVIQINFGSTFLDSTVRASNEVNRKKLQAILDEKNLKMSDSLAKPVIEEFKKSNPSLFADVETVANHVDHVVQLIGINHVGIGSDFDGVGDSLPTGLKDVSQYPNLIYALLKRGYTEADIEKICYKNVWRVWNSVEKKANELK